ncbi:glycosyltransferase family 2 protein [Dactylosporangium aurantiacum]|uniref:Glycosyltransferase family 2 protein n=1 Tax=Dactylosporangium aurantiacum TaxID=35754 RepID=A0A9Q9IK91_9ACTN|nr:glycosyltransferase family 2 protein [Dactylosporangium aurantiacum]MDG6103199.1 glycosyltransferase family 2 protein [Dactylosporangium aurantiacum]UWZ57704.1 glycosyltransferase family 2 protein [Dactylosporangium aurantiacum]
MIILLPVYQPGHGLVTTVTALRDAAPGAHLVVVDDGSGPASAQVLRDAEDLGCTVLRHEANRGKGVALKTGFRHVATAHPGQAVVCADPDGQHRVADILRVAEHVEVSGRMVLGVRRFEGRVPLRSRFGNAVTRLLFRAATGRPVLDTQTGLRGYPAGLLDWLCRVPGERFEYEMTVLLRAAREGLPIEQTVIATTYLGDNGSSHFSSLKDSARVYRPLLRYALAPSTRSRG